MNRLLLLALLTFFSNFCFAAVPNDESLDRLFKNMNIESALEDIILKTEREMHVVIEERVAVTKLTKRQKDIVDSIPNEFMPIIRSEYSWNKRRPIYLKLYKDTFSQEEIDDLNAFYESKTGKAFLRKTPVLNALVKSSMEESERLVKQKMEYLVQKYSTEFKGVK